MNYYNEINAQAAHWLRNLIDAGEIPAGDVDERSIEDVRPSDLRGYTQCHFFAGVGGWSLALRLAGWPATRPVWTGSPPCQPFSSAGQGKGERDARHLWPIFFNLIQACRPPIVFGEQVASALTVGRANAYMPEVSDREAVLSVLRELERESPLGLRRLREGCRENKKEVQPKAHEHSVSCLAGQEARSCADKCCEAQGEESWASVRSGPEGHSGKDRCGPLRDDRNTVRSGGAEGMECAVFGSDRARCRLYDQQCTGCSVCAERDVEHMGSGKDCRDRQCDLREEEGCIECLIESIGGEAKRSAEWAWFDTVSADLERAHYAVRACDTPSAGIGGAHIRQRLYWVAESGDRVLRSRTRSSGDGFWLANPNGRNPGTEREQRGGELGLHAQDDGACGLGITDSPGPQPGRDATQAAGYGRAVVAAGDACRLADNHIGAGQQGRAVAPGRDSGGDAEQGPGSGSYGQLGGVGDASSQGLPQRVSDSGIQRGALEPQPWQAIVGGSPALWLCCTDGKLRPCSPEPGAFPLAYGLSRELVRGQPELGRLAKGAGKNRRTRLSGYGNAIDPRVAAAFIRAAAA